MLSCSVSIKDPCKTDRHHILSYCTIKVLWCSFHGGVVMCWNSVRLQCVTMLCDTELRSRGDKVFVVNVALLYINTTELQHYNATFLRYWCVKQKLMVTVDSCTVIRLVSFLPHTPWFSYLCFVTHQIIQDDWRSVDDEY